MTQLRKYEDLLADKTYAIGVQEGEIRNTTKIINDEKFIFKENKENLALVQLYMLNYSLLKIQSTY